TPPKPNAEDVYSSARRSLRPLPQAPASSPSTIRPSPGRHDRGQSVDIGKLSLNDRRQSDYERHGQSTPTRPSAIRPNSMILTRSDSINRGGSAAVAHAY